MCSQLKINMSAYKYDKDIFYNINTIALSHMPISSVYVHNSPYHSLLYIF